MMKSYQRLGCKRPGWRGNSNDVDDGIDNLINKVIPKVRLIRLLGHMLRFRNHDITSNQSLDQKEN